MKFRIKFEHETIVEANSITEAEKVFWECKKVEGISLSEFVNNICEIIEVMEE